MQTPEGRGLTMNTRQAKDFLAQQAADQAALEKVPFSDLEKRMMYFTESDPSSCDNPIDLNADFEKQYDTKEYEPKISRLLHHSYKRLKNEDRDKLRYWTEAIDTLRKGDHYVLVFLDADSELDQQDPRTRVQQGRRTWVVIAWGIGLGIAVVILMMLAIILDHYFLS
jgi:hypothetical protein